VPEPDETRSPTEANNRRDLTGRMIGRFVVRERLGAGGMGEVYLAYDNQLRRAVAIKRLVSGHDLLKEARRASSLNHPGIAAVYDVFTEADELFLVMEYVDGQTLRQLGGGPVGTTEFCPLARQCLEALAAAHQHGILHGDLKPSNIMVTRDGTVKVCDFGLARRLHPAADMEDSVTAIEGHKVIGTPPYMAPEVLLEQPADARADLFSLGVVFYEILSGRNPFAAVSVMATLDAVLHKAPEPLNRTNPAVPPRLARLVHRMLEKDPSRRYAAAADILRDLAGVTAHLTQSSHRLRRRRIVAAVAAGAILVAGAMTVLWPGGVFRAGNPPLPANLHVAILPFAQTSPDPARGFVAQGLTEAVTTRLARVAAGQLQVASVSDVRARAVTRPSDAREHLGANVALTGSLAYSPRGVDITLALVDTRSGQPLRTGTFRSEPGDLLALQDRMVGLAVELMELRLSGADTQRLTAHETAQPGAYDFYLQGRGYLLNYDRLENVESAIAVFRRALEIDRRYALAYAGLGQAYWRKHELTGSSTWVEPARGSCEGALAIDSTLSEPHACLAMVLAGTGEYAKAADEYTLALQSEPTNDVLYSGLANAYERLGRGGDAEQAYRRAIVQRPNYWSAYNVLGAFYYRAARYDDAAAMFQQVVNLAPDSFRGYSSLGAAHFMRDQIADATAAFEKSLALRPNFAAASNLGTLLFFEGQLKRSAEMFRQAVSLDKGSYQVWGNLAAVLDASGRRDEGLAAHREARRLVEERLMVNPRDAALHIALADHLAALDDPGGARAHLQAALDLKPADAHFFLTLALFYEQRLQQRDRALKALTEAVSRGQTWREVDRSPLLADLRRDPRFQSLRHPL